MKRSKYNDLEMKIEIEIEKILYLKTSTTPIIVGTLVMND